MTPTKGLLISFVCEEGEKGPLAKYLREEDPARVARVTTKVHYGRVEVGSMLTPTFKCSPANFPSLTGIPLRPSLLMGMDLSSRLPPLRMELQRSKQTPCKHCTHS